jgi:hypothetical protein
LESYIEAKKKDYAMAFIIYTTMSWEQLTSSSVARRTLRATFEILNALYSAFDDTFVRDDEQ